MGVDYFDCHECGETLCDAGDYYTLDIKGLGEYTVCSDCKDTLLEHLCPDGDILNSYRYFVKTQDGVVFVNSIDKLTEYNGIFGCYLESKIPDTIKRGIQGQGHTINEIKEFVVKDKIKGYVYVGWQTGTKNETSFCFDYRKDNVDDLISKIQEEGLKYHGKPFVITAFHMNKYIDHPSSLDTYCVCNDRNSKKLQWFQNLDDLKLFVGDPDNYTWSVLSRYKFIPDRFLLSEKLEELQEKIKKYTKQYNDLEALIN